MCGGVQFPCVHSVMVTSNPASTSKSHKSTLSRSLLQTCLFWSSACWERQLGPSVPYTCVCLTPSNDTADLSPVADAQHGIFSEVTLQ